MLAQAHGHAERTHHARGRGGLPDRGTVERILHRVAPPVGRCQLARRRPAMHKGGGQGRSEDGCGERAHPMHLVVVPSALVPANRSTPPAAGMPPSPPPPFTTRARAPHEPASVGRGVRPLPVPLAVAICALVPARHHTRTPTTHAPPPRPSPAHGPQPPVISPPARLPAAVRARRPHTHPAGRVRAPRTCFR